MTRTPAAILRTFLLALPLAAALPLPAHAQLPPEIRGGAQEPPARFRGTVASADNENLTIRRPDGRTLTFAMSPRTRVYAVLPNRVRDIKPESYVAVLSRPGPEPRQASAVTIFSPSERGFEAGDRPWDGLAGTSLTGGWVTGLRRSESRDSERARVSLAYEGGQATFAVPAGTPVTQFAPGEKAMLVPGASIVVLAQDGPDGTPQAGAVAVGRRGAVPGL